MRSEDLLPIGELARRTGVNPVTLRAWERRYGLLKPQRTAKGHRLYPLEQVERVEAVLAWLQRGASVGQVRELLDKPASTPPKGDWQARQFQLIEAIAGLSQRALDQQLNQAMALYPAVTLCEQLLLPLLDMLDLRWRNYFNARLEQVFFTAGCAASSVPACTTTTSCCKGLPCCWPKTANAPSARTYGCAPGYSPAMASRSRCSSSPSQARNC